MLQPAHLFCITAPGQMETIRCLMLCGPLLQVVHSHKGANRKHSWLVTPSTASAHTQSCLAEEKNKHAENGRGMGEGASCCLLARAHHRNSSLFSSKTLLTRTALSSMTQTHLELFSLRQVLLHIDTVQCSP